VAKIDEILAADLDATAFDAEADESPSESVTYTPSGGAAATLNAVLEPVFADRTDSGDARHDAASRSIIIRTDAVGGIPSPAVGDAVTVAAEGWVVDLVEWKGRGLAMLRLVRQSRRRQGTPGSYLEGGGR